MSVILHVAGLFLVLMVVGTGFMFIKTAALSSLFAAATPFQWFLL